ncbi:hypothetical protein, partial [Enterobacter roggenkampii]|uniref:hypothetical protein n=1 Tax=Enterobacter roggenkampii TaxID=1812935 RepID=UPI002A7EAA87
RKQYISVCFLTSINYPSSLRLTELASLAIQDITSAFETIFATLRTFCSMFIVRSESKIKYLIWPDTALAQILSHFDTSAL